MDAKLILVRAAMLGGLGGFVWATAPAAMTNLTMSDSERAAVEASAAAVEASVYYGGCDAVRALGKDPLYAGEPGYREEMDGDGDGIACEAYR